MHNFLALFTAHFLGRAPGWYKASIVGFLLLNPLVLWLAGSVLSAFIAIITRRID